MIHERRDSAPNISNHFIAKVSYLAVSGEAPLFRSTLWGGIAMLPSLKVKSLQHGAFLGDGCMPWYDQPTRLRPSPIPRFGHIVVSVVTLIPMTISARPSPTVDTVPVHTVVEAAENVSLEVLRDQATLDCPDASQIRGALPSHSRSGSPDKLNLLIEFQRQDSFAVATITASGTKTGTRELRLGTPDCRLLLDPLVVSLTMLLDPDARIAGDFPATAKARPKSTGLEIRTAVASEAPPFSPAESTSIVPGAVATTSVPPTFARAKGQLPKPTANVGRVFGFGIDIGPQLMVGLIPQVAYGLEIQVAAAYSLLSLRVAMAGFAADERSFGEAKARGQTYFARVGLCAQGKWQRDLLLSICQGAWLGQLLVSARGFPTDRSSEPLFWALGGLGEVNYSMTGSLGTYLRAGAFVPITQHRFNIDGYPGPVFRSQGFGAWLGTGISCKFL